jgi:hypothetical protein
MVLHEKKKKTEVSARGPRERDTVIREGYGFDGLHGVVEPMANSSLHVGFECNDLVFAALLASIGYACGSRKANTVVSCFNH